MNTMDEGCPASNAIEVPSPPSLSVDERAFLLQVAVGSLVRHFGLPSVPIPPPEQGGVLEPRGVFVSIHRGDTLRGCLGVLRPAEPLWKLVEHLAVQAATRDPRFDPVEVVELRELSVEISVLGPMLHVEPAERDLLVQRVRIGEHGLAARHRGRSGLLLPQVPAQYGWDVRRFLEETCRKAGLPDDAWRESEAEISVFHCTVVRGTVSVAPPLGGTPSVDSPEVLS